MASDRVTVEADSVEEALQKAVKRTDVEDARCAYIERQDDGPLYAVGLSSVRESLREPRVDNPPNF